MNPMVSFMIPVYNGESLIRDSIESVIDQPYENIELIIMDDGSSDSTLQICNDYALRDQRIKVYSHPNVGLGKNRNIGYEYLRGKWTVFLDHDDLVTPRFLTNEFVSFLDECEKKDIEVIVPSRVCTNYDVSLGRIELVPVEGVYDGRDSSWFIKYQFASLIYKTELLLEKKIFFHEGFPEMESIFRHKAAYLANKVLFTNKVMVSIKRSNPESIMHTWNYISVLPVCFSNYCKLLEWHCMYDKEDTEVQKGCVDYIDKLIYDYIVSLSMKIGYKGVPDKIKSNGMLDFINNHNSDNTYRKEIQRFLKHPFYFTVNYRISQRRKSFSYKRKAYPLSIDWNTPPFSNYNINLTDII